MKKFLLVITSVFIYIITRLFHMTYRYRYDGNSIIQMLKNNHQNFIFAIWHQNLFAGILAQTGLKHIVIVSKSNDAEPVAFTCRRLGHLVVRGSSRKGTVDKNGQAAKEEMIHFLKEGHPGAVTVDGPKGPVFKVKPGIIDMAKKSNAVLIPYIVCPKSYWQFKSWDSFRLPKPFSKILVSYGDPIAVGMENTTYEANQIKLELALNKQTIAAQKNLTSWDTYPSTNWWKFKK